MGYSINVEFKKVQRLKLDLTPKSEPSYAIHVYCDRHSDLHSRYSEETLKEFIQEKLSSPEKVESFIREFYETYFDEDDYYVENARSVDIGGKTYFFQEGSLVEGI